MLSFPLHYPSPPSSSSSPQNSLFSSDSSPGPFSSSSPTPAPLSHPHRDPKPRHVPPPSRVNIAHPYARIYAKKDGTKRRKIWNHALEKCIFTPHELSSIGAPHRRTIYIASLEAHVDRLHAQLMSIGYFPIDPAQLEPFKGLNSKTAKSMVAGLQHDASHLKLKLLELERSNDRLRKSLSGTQLLPTHEIQPSRRDYTPPSSAFYAKPEPFVQS